jgi:hypothetical protein
MAAAAVPVFVHDDVKAVQELYVGLVGRDALSRSCAQQAHLLAERLSEGHRAHHPGAYVELRNWHPDLGGETERTVWGRPLGPGDFLTAVSREHGYADAGACAPG